MNAFAQLRKWFADVIFKRTISNEPAALREFVYLDDVSVHSILASRTRGIATQFTESQRSSTIRDVDRSVGIGLGSTNARTNARSRTDNARSSEVLSKAVIQTSFKELYELQRDSLALPLPDQATPPGTIRVSDLQGMLASAGAGRPWLFDPGNLCRGDLIELEVALEAEPIFHLVSVFGTVMALFKDNEDLLGFDVAAQLSQFASLVRVLEGLLAGLVPVRGRLVAYKSATIGKKNILIHQKLLDQFDTDDLTALRNVYVVGVAERDMFWKDIRRVLFSGAQYTAFCRVATEGLATTWHPIKVANVLGGIVPNFDQVMVDLSEMARRAIAGTNVSVRNSFHGDLQHGKNIPTAYAKLLADHHGQPLTAQTIDSITQLIPGTSDWLNSVDQRRSVFANVTSIVEETVNPANRVDGETRFQFREAALSAMRLSSAQCLANGRINLGTEPPQPDHDVVFLDTEIIAIYW